jgi:hypothetical protein
VFANNSYFTLSSLSLKTFHLFYEKLFFSTSECHLSHFPWFYSGKREKKKNLTLRCCSWRYSFIMRVLSTPDEQQKRDGEGFPECQVLNPNQLSSCYLQCVFLSEYEKLNFSIEVWVAKITLKWILRMENNNGVDWGNANSELIYYALFAKFIGLRIIKILEYE